MQTLNNIIPLLIDKQHLKAAHMSSSWPPGESTSEKLVTFLLLQHILHSWEIDTNPEIIWVTVHMPLE